MVFLPLSVVSEHAHGGGKLRVVGDGGSSFAIGAEIFAGIEAETAGIADRAGETSFVFGGVGLAGVFNHNEIMFFGYI